MWERKYLDCNRGIQLSAFNDAMKRAAAISEQKDISEHVTEVSTDSKVDMAENFERV